MKVSFEGIGMRLATFLTDGTLADGAVCAVTGEDTVGTCAVGDRFCGVAEHVSADTAAVQLAGFVELPYTGDTAPTVGYTALAADGAGGVTAGSGETYLVLHVDTAAQIVGFLL